MWRVGERAMRVTVDGCELDESVLQRGGEVWRASTSWDPALEVATSARGCPSRSNARPIEPTANLSKGGRFSRSAALWLKVRAWIADTRKGVCPGADLDSVTPWDARWTCRRLRRYRAPRFEHGFRDLFRPAGDLRRPEYDYRVGLMRLALQGSSQETCMTNARPSQRQLAEQKNSRRHEEMQRAVADGRLVIRGMTVREREQSEARWAAAANARENRAKRGQRS